jgi:hypothetical protein
VGHEGRHGAPKKTSEWKGGEREGRANLVKAMKKGFAMLEEQTNEMSKIITDISDVGHQNQKTVHSPCINSGFYVGQMFHVTQYAEHNGSALWQLFCVHLFEEYVLHMCARACVCGHVCHQSMYLQIYAA